MQSNLQNTNKIYIFDLQSKIIKKKKQPKQKIHQNKTKNYEIENRNENDYRNKT